MDIVVSKTDVYDTAPSLSRTRLVLGDQAWLESDAAGDVVVYGQVEPRGVMRWFGARRVRLGKLSSDIGDTVKPLLAEDRKYRARFVDVPGPHQAQPSVSISIWAQSDGDQRTRIDAPRPLPARLHARF